MELKESIVPMGERIDKLAVMSEFAPVPTKLSALEQMLEELRIKNLEAIRLLSKNRKTHTPSENGSLAV